MITVSPARAVPDPRRTRRVDIEPGIGSKYRVTTSGTTIGPGFSDKMVVDLKPAAIYPCQVTILRALGLTPETTYRRTA